MAESGHDYLEILPNEAVVAMNRPLVEIPLLGTDSGKYLRSREPQLYVTLIMFYFVCQSINC